MGDVAGIGPEIIARFFWNETPDDVIVVGDPAHMERAIRLIGAPLAVQPIESLLQSRHPKSVPLLAVGEVPSDLPYGKVDARAGRLAFEAVIEAIRLAKAGAIGGLVTAPIHKEALRAAGISFPGHTEILAHETGVTDFAMVLAEEHLRVILVSIHVSLREALDRITFEHECRAIRLAQTACTAFGIARPRIAVAGLNPHAGEGGLFGREEIEIIAPAIAAMRAEGLDVSGPFPPDTVFMQAKRGKFDIVVSQYHDQGLIPVKLGGIERGVNITIGLPIIRTSVDHGTAFDIAGRGIADASSLTEAVRLARAMIATRSAQS
jgi:4-hydroxythreonine-4-phosphate dehydrogenase